MVKRIHVAALQALFHLARQDRPADLCVLAQELGLSCAQTDRLLAELDVAGLADAEAVRLTLAGLAVAVSAPRLRRRERAAAAA